MDTRTQIITLLKTSTNGLTITDISHSISLNRNSVARYLDVLTKQGIISERVIGPAKVYYFVSELSYDKQINLYKRAMDAASCGITIADTSLPDFPLIYVNDAFLEMTGYSSAEVIGRNCRFLQGNLTKQPGLTIIRESLKNGVSCDVSLTNFTKQGKKFTNNLFLSPIKNDDGDITHYVGIQTKKD